MPGKRPPKYHSSPSLGDGKAQPSLAPTFSHRSPAVSNGLNLGKPALRPRCEGATELHHAHATILISIEHLTTGFKHANSFIRLEDGSEMLQLIAQKTTALAF